MKRFLLFLFAWSSVALGSTIDNKPKIGGSLSDGTTGSVLFSGSGVFAQDNANFFWDDTSNRLGIGTTTPNQQLELTGNLRLPASTTTTGIYYSDGNTFLHSFGTATSLFLGSGAGNLTNTGTSNVGIGPAALDAVTSGGQNTALGFDAVGATTTASSNTGIGHKALRSATGGSNTAVGNQAGLSVSTGTQNTLVGGGAAQNLSTGNSNVAIGQAALIDLVSGSSSTAVGERALENATGGLNTGIGYFSGAAVITGTSNTFLGYLSDTTSSSITNSTAIGANAIVGASNSMVLGDTATPVSVGIGSNSPAARLDVVGASDIIQLNIRGHTAQNTDILNVEATGGADSLTVNGDDEASGANVVIRGTATNDSAATGFVGEFLSQERVYSSALSLTNTVAANVTTTALTLTAGDWDIEGALIFIPAAATSIVALTGAISTTSATLPADDTFAVGTAGEVKTRYSGPSGGIITGGNEISLPIPRIRASISGSTTFYLVARGNFTLDTLSVAGQIQARRVR